MKPRISTTLAAATGAALLAAGAAWSPPVAATDPFIGQIQYFPYSFPPRDFAFCNGQLIAIAQNSALFSLLGTIYGGNGRTDFALPDMQGRSPLHVGMGTGSGLSPRRLGERGGTERVTLTNSELPSHNHALNASSARGDLSNPTGAVLARDGRDETYRDEAPNTDMHAGSILATGGGQAHENMAPFLAVNCNIALSGVFPSRP